MQDTVQALVSDCDHPPLKRMKNIEAFINRCMKNYNDIRSRLCYSC